MMQTCDHEVIIACSALKDPLDKLLEKQDHKATVQYLEAGLHLRPKLLKEALTKAVRQAQAQGADIKVIYGNCCPEIDTVCSRHNARRMDIENCYHLYLGDGYSKLVEEEPGTYFLDPFLATNFEELVIQQLGLDRYPKLKSMLFKHYNRLVYIDARGTGLAEEATSVADYLGLPIETVKADPDRFQHLFSEIM